jgi:Subtilase family
VGSTTNTDARSSFSNYGTCLDIYAPGSNIVSASYSTDTGSTTMSGTSMASPHVAGVAALYRQQNPSATPQQVRDALVNGGTAGVVTDAKVGSPNVLLNSLLTGGGGTPPPPPPPTGNIQNGGFESGNVGWTASTGVIDGTTSGSAPRTGSYKAWMNGYGVTHTDTLSQSFTASGTNLCFWLKVTSAETTTSIAYDNLTVQLKNSAGTVVSTQTYSNLNKSTSYSQKCFSIGSYSGQTITLAFTGTEDSSLQTSFFIDDVTAQ